MPAHIQEEAGPATAADLLAATRRVCEESRRAVAQCIGIAEPRDDGLLGHDVIEQIALANGFKKSVEHWGVRFYTEFGSDLFRFADALIAAALKAREGA